MKFTINNDLRLLLPVPTSVLEDNTYFVQILGF